MDAQVRAIWTALVNEYRLQYINPPPAYSKQSQRLRTPSDILASNTGRASTWRCCSPRAWSTSTSIRCSSCSPATPSSAIGDRRRRTTVSSSVETIPAKCRGRAASLARARRCLRRRYGWRLTRLHYDEIMEYVTSGDLVMLEATYLTGAKSFADAMKEGRANMRSRREFDSLLDIRLARSATPPVTPLPIINE